MTAVIYLVKTPNKTEYKITTFYYILSIALLVSTVKVSGKKIFHTVPDMEWDINIISTPRNPGLPMCFIITGLYFLIHGCRSMGQSPPSSLGLVKLIVQKTNHFLPRILSVIWIFGTRWSGMWNYFMSHKMLFLILRWKCWWLMVWLHELTGLAFQGNNQHKTKF